MGWTGNLEQGLAAKLAELGAGVWDPDGTTGTIVTGALPDEISNGIGVQAYGIQPDPALADVVQPVQLWIRGDDAFVKDAADIVIDGLVGVVKATLGGVHCSLIGLHSDVPMGVDDSGRRERALNLDISASRPTASRPD